MTRLSKNLTRSEFACKCGCGYDTADSELVYIVQDVRDHFNAPVSINSGCRCPTYNAAIGGAVPSSTSRGSQHLYGRAADITVKGFTPKEVVEYLKDSYPDRYGIGEYETFIHVDSRGEKARW